MQILIHCKGKYVYNIRQYQPRVLIEFFPF